MKVRGRRDCPDLNSPHPSACLRMHSARRCIRRNSFAANAVWPQLHALAYDLGNEPHVRFLASHLLRRGKS